MRIILVVLAFTGFLSHAQEDRGFVADRPGATDSPVTTLPGTARVESGLYSYSRDSEGGLDTTTQVIGNLVFALGLSENSELQLGFDSHVRTKVEGGAAPRTESEFGNLNLRYKYNIIGNDGGDVAFGIIPRLTYTSESLGNDLLGGIGLPVAFSLPQKFLIAVMPQWNLEEKSNGGHYSSQYLGVLLGRSWTDNLDVYIDYSSTSNEEATFQAAAGLGLAHRIQSNLQWDISGSFGVSEAASDLTLAVGVVYQWGI